MKLGSRDAKVSADRFFGNTPQNMQTKFQAKGMDKVRKWLESRIALSRRNSIDCRRVSPKLIQTEFGIRGVGARGVIRHVPAGIDDNIFPAELLEMLRHPSCIGANVVFTDCLAVSVPTVPAHRRTSRKRGS